MKRKLPAILMACGFFFTTYGADFEFGYVHVFQTNALTHVVEEQNIQRRTEGTIHYWSPSVNGQPARLTQRFSFPRPTERAFLKAFLTTYNFGGGNYGSGSLWASKNGTNWVLLMDCPTPSSIDASYWYATNVPPDVLGGTELWIQARLETYGWQIMAQFLRRATLEDNVSNVFALEVDYVPELSIETAAVRLRWHTKPDVSYNVQWSTDFQVWSNLASVLGTGGETNLVEWTDQQKRFYRVQTVQ
jgi:hypothetical protein